ncbi:hypothetical protein J6590_050297 [Homalodisca vitripennis]|nr:hypothetical protein J6590_050297 [Homalodisca vitripennis]
MSAVVLVAAGRTYRSAPLTHPSPQTAHPSMREPFHHQRQQGPMHKCINVTQDMHLITACLTIGSQQLKSPSYAGAKMWNALPEDLKKIDRKHFRQTLKNWLLHRPFYSLNKFYGMRT